MTSRKNQGRAGLGATFVQPVYVAKLRTLGPLELAEPTTFGPPMMIRFDGGEALLMPINNRRS